MRQKKNKTINRWAAIMALAFLLLFVVIAGRFVYLAKDKTVEGHNLMTYGEKNWTHVKSIDVHRGSILGRNGQVLAHDVPAYTLYAVISHDAPEYVKDIHKTASELAPIIGMDESEITDLLSKDRYRVELGPGGRKLSYDDMKKIKALKLPGLGFMQESKRYYPNGNFASYTLGFTRMDDKTGEQTGKLGLEKSLNKYLTEQDGSMSFYSSENGVKMPNVNEDIKKPKEGDNVYTTIDSRIQTVMENALSKAQKHYKPQKMFAIAMDPETGQILAMSQRPGFDPNKMDKMETYLNYPVSYPFEPGSVMKIFTLSAAIDAGKFPYGKTYKSGTLKSGKTTIHDWNTGWGTIPWEQALERSSNVGFARLERDFLGRETFLSYLKKFGFDEKTGIDLPNEANSHINMSVHDATSQMMTAFGQASAFTPLQIVQAASAIANGGKMMKPYVVDKIVNPATGEVVKKNEPEKAGNPISADTAKKTREQMRQVIVGDHGTGADYNLKNYKVVGKTGTAQLFIDGHYTSGKGNYVYSFIGMAPQDDPKVLVYVAVDRPELKPTEGGSDPVSDIFNPVMSTALQYKKVDKQKPDQSIELQSIGDLTGTKIDDAVKEIKDKGLDPVVIGDGNSVARQSLMPGTDVLSGTKVMLLTDGQAAMPDLTGWSMSEVLRFSQLMEVTPDIEGDGFVTSQTPKKGTAIKSGSSIKAELSPPDIKKNGTPESQDTSPGEGEPGVEITNDQG